MIWEYLLSLKLGSGSYEFGGISKVAKAVHIFYQIQVPVNREFFSFGEKQNVIPALPPGIGYTGLPVDYQNGPQRVLFRTTCRFVDHCEESYFEQQQRASVTRRNSCSLEL